MDNVKARRALEKSHQYLPVDFDRYLARAAKLSMSLPFERCTTVRCYAIINLDE
jgi:hypothetical protein